MANPFYGVILVIASLFGYYIDYLFVRFLFRFGHGIVEWLGGPKVIGTGIGLLLTLLLMGLILGVFTFSSIGIYVGYSITVDRRWRVFPRRRR